MESHFYSTLDRATDMPTGTKRFVGALYRAMENKPVSPNMTEERIDEFSNKFKNFAGAATEGVKNVLNEIANDMRRTEDEVLRDNVSEEIMRDEEEGKLKEERKRAEEMMKEIEWEERVKREEEAEKESKAKSKMRRKGKGKLMLRRIDVDEADEDYGSGEDADEEKKRFEKKKRRTLIKTVQSISDRMKEIGDEDNMASREMSRYIKDSDANDPLTMRQLHTPELWERKLAMTSRRAKKWESSLLFNTKLSWRHYDRRLLCTKYLKVMW